MDWAQAQKIWSLQQGPIQESKQINLEPDLIGLQLLSQVLLVEHLEQEKLQEIFREELKTYLEQSPLKHLEQLKLLEEFLKQQEQLKLLEEFLKQQEG